MKASIYFCIAIILIIASCDKNESSKDIDFRQEMREFVIGISQYSKEINKDFIVIPQNGIELISKNGEVDGQISAEYLNAIDGNGQEDLFYGYDDDNTATPNEVTNYLKGFLNKSKDAGKTILVTDYCSSNSKISNSYTQNNKLGFISFAATERNLNVIPNLPNPIFQENNANITKIEQAKNFLYLINPENFDSKADYISAVCASNYDLLVMDLFFNDETPFTNTEITQLKNKANGGKRLVICYLSIGEAENYRYYWQNSWNKNKPSWLDKENPDWEGNYKVKYWDSNWQKIIYGNENSYLKKIINANFDGVYLDIIDAFEYYENL